MTPNALLAYCKSYCEHGRLLDKEMDDVVLAFDVSPSQAECKNTTFVMRLMASPLRTSQQYRYRNERFFIAQSG